MSIVQNELYEYEQFVNDRRLSSPPADIPSDLVPETSSAIPMLWVVLPTNEVNILSESGDKKIPSYGKGLLGNGGRIVYFPLHPLQIKAYQGKKIIESGTARISSSYRTLFYEPDQGNIIKFKPPNGYSLMLKLHLDKPLPGVKGDRRLTYEKVKKCIDLSRELCSLEKKKELSPHLSLVPEEIGLVHENRGAIIRKIPKLQLIPAFSLSSPDLRNPKKEILAVTILRKAQELCGTEATDLFGEIFVKPLVDSLLSAFKLGFSLEMHMQNVLFHFNEIGQVKKIFYRDLEGIVLSNKFRQSRGLSKLFPGDTNPELFKDEYRFRRFFNRNLDHDLGRIFKNLLVALEKSGIFQKNDIHYVEKSARKIVRSCISKYGFKNWCLWNKWLRFSRSPYGNGKKLGHYYYCRFR